MLSNPTSTWLQWFYLHQDTEFIEGDGPATTRNLCGAVVLGALLNRSTSPDRLSEITGLPVSFCAVAIFNLEYNHMWESESFLGLCSTLRDNINDAEEITGSLEVFLEDYWVHSKMPGIEQILPALRGRSLLFGRSQTWTDDQRLEELIGEPFIRLV